MKTRKILLASLPFLFMLLFNPVLTHAQEQDEEEVTFTLQQAQAYALNHYADVQNAHLDRIRAKKDIKETVATGLPQINGSASLQKNFDIQTNIIQFGQEEVTVKFGTEYNLDASINASQLIFDGTFFVGLRASRTYSELVRKELDQTETQTRINVAKAYYAVLLANEQFDILDQNLARTEKDLEETKKRFDAGFIEELDVDRLQLTYQSLQNEMNTATRERSIAYKLLKFQMGYPITDTITVSQNLDNFTDEAEISDNLLSRFQPEKRIEYKVLQIQEDLAYLNIKQYQATYLPRLNLFAAHSQLAQRNEFNFFNSGEDWFSATYAGLQLQVPIFQGLGRSARVQKAKIDLQKVENNKEQLKESFLLDIKQAKSRYESALERLKNQEENVSLAQKIFDRTKVKYREGVGSSLETTTAQSALFQAQSTYLNALYDYLIAKIELKKAIGNY